MKKIRLGFVKRLVLAYSLVLVVLLSLLFGAAYLYILRIGEQNAMVNLEQLQAKTLMQMDQFFGELQRTAETLRANTNLINSFSTLREAPDAENYFDKNVIDAIDLQSQLISLLGPSSSVWRVVVYNQYGDIISNDPGFKTAVPAEGIPARDTVEATIAELQAMENHRWIRPMQADGSPMHSATVAENGPPYVVYACLLTNYYQTETYAVIEIHQTMERLENYLSLDVVGDAYTFLFGEDGGQVYPAGTQLAQLPEGQFFIGVPAKTSYGWSVALAQSREHYIASYRAVLFPLFMAGFLILVVLLVIIFIVTKSISKPLVNLTGTVRAMSIESIPLEIAPQSENDEIRELNTAFSSMLQRLNDAILLERKAYLLALQSQIDPHFLYNSLATVSSMALQKGNDDIADFCDTLSNMLRYSTSYESQGATLQDELDNARNYLELMKLRYEDLFSYRLEVDEALNRVSIPKLTLQPILENCFKHAFKDIRPPWQITIRGYIRDGKWVLAVQDNGSGISDATIKDLYAKVEEYSKDIKANYTEMRIGGMGLLNTLIRLKLVGNGNIHYGVRQSRPCGTEVILEGDYENQGIDCRR